MGTLIGLAALALGVVVWTRLRELSTRQSRLERDVARLTDENERLHREMAKLARAATTAPPPPPPGPTAPPAPVPSPVTMAAPAPAPPPRPVQAATPIAASRPLFSSSPVAQSREPERSERLEGPDPADNLPDPIRWLIDFFTTGNIVAKVGMVVVFFGVAFLLRYAAERGMLPIEYRLMSTAAGALALLGFGWHLRHSKPEYAIVLQGGAVGVLYLTIFAAFRLYGLLPATLTFALLLAVVAFSSTLAVAQRAMSLAVLGTSGGFLAPILASTGGGSHVGLFSYYAVLNAGVLGIAWFQSWRFLNWLAFIFTFGIGAVWGQQYYQPAYFATTEPFLVLFFLLFVAVAVLYAHRQPPQLRGYIDGSLVFGTPAVAFGMQSVLAGDIPLGRAYSAVALSALYLALTRVLWRHDAALRPLTEAFLALAVAFLILAVPMAFDGHGTAVAWALEGAGLVWIGIRQQRPLARWVGTALILGAGASFATVIPQLMGGTTVLNRRFLGAVAIAVASITAARLASRASSTPSERASEPVLLAWGLLWWFGAVLAEVAVQGGPRIPALALLTIAGSACLMGLLARRWNWRAMTLAVLPVGPLMWIWIQPFLVADHGPLGELGWLAWPAALASSYVVVFWFEDAWPPEAVKVWHTATAWVLVVLVTSAAVFEARRLMPESATWSAATMGAVPTAFVLALLGVGSRVTWPVGRFPSLYTGLIALGPTAFSLLWVIDACARAGTPAPLPYIPLFNPLELTQALVLVAAFAWESRLTPGDELSDAVRPAIRPLLAGIAFLALNAIVARSVHAFVGVPFTPEDLAASPVFQTGISILWGLTAGALMTLARVWSDRPVWITGASVMAALLVKLFVIDLGNVGGIARIVSFLATGALILAIGYFAPVPPKKKQAE